MKKIIIFLFTTSLIALFAKDINTSTKKLLEKQALEKAMKQEKKFAKEQKFYNAENYDFKGAEVNEESLKNVPLIPVDPFDITDVYK